MHTRQRKKVRSCSHILRRDFFFFSLHAAFDNKNGWRERERERERERASGLNMKNIPSDQRDFIDIPPFPMAVRRSDERCFFFAALLESTKSIDQWGKSCEMSKRFFFKRKRRRFLHCQRDNCTRRPFLCSILIIFFCSWMNGFKKS